MSSQIHAYRQGMPLLAPSRTPLSNISDISGPQRPVSLYYTITGILLFTATLAINGPKLAFFLLMLMVIAGCLMFSFTMFREALYLFAYAIPLEQGFYSYGGGRFNTLSYLAFFMAFIWVFRFGRTIETAWMSTTEKIIIFWAMWAGLSLIWTREFAGGFGTLMYYIGGFTVLYSYSRGLKSLRHLGTCAWFYIIGTLHLSLFLLPYYKAGAAYVYVGGRYIPSAIGLGYGIAPHEVSRTYAMSMICALMLWQYENTKLKRNIAMGLAIFFGILAALCISRSTVLALTVGLMAWMIFKGAKARLIDQVKRFIIFLLLISSVVALVSYVNREAFMSRVESSQDDYEHGHMVSLTSRRTLLWNTAIQFSIENPFLGVGLYSFPILYGLRTGDRPLSVHNAYLGTMAELGIVGLLLFSGWIFSFGWHAWKLKGMRHLALGWWITFALILVGHDLWRGKDFWLMMSFIMIMRRLETPKARSVAAGAGPQTLRRVPAPSRQRR